MIWSNALACLLVVFGPDFAAVVKNRKLLPQRSEGGVSKLALIEVNRP